MIDLGNIPDGQLLKCSHCGSFRINVDENNLIKNTEVYGRAYKETLNTTKILFLVKLFEKHFTPVNEKFELLDVGFGTGDFLKEMSHKGLIVSGLENNHDSVKAMSNEMVTVYYGEVGGKINLNKEFEFITLWDILEHVNDIKKAMYQLYSLTRKNGSLFIITPDAGSFFDTLAAFERRISFYHSQRIINICLNRYHLHRFSTKGLNILLHRFGFKIVHMQTIQLFSLEDDQYTNGFAPGILRWTPNAELNFRISKFAMKIIKCLNLRNKIFTIAVKI